MDLQQALEIVSYKLALKQGATAAEDPILIAEVVEKALEDQSTGQVRSIEAREYMQATKLVKQHRLERAEAAGKAYLAEQAKQPQTQRCDSGVLYRVLDPGDGPRPSAGDSVTVHYHGTLIDGTVFDSSVERGKPATFALSKVIAGWREAVLMMSLGSRYQVMIPHELGYGDRGTTTTVPPYATLIFDLELLEIHAAAS